MRERLAIDFTSSNKKCLQYDVDIVFHNVLYYSGVLHEYFKVDDVVVAIADADWLMMMMMIMTIDDDSNDDDDSDNDDDDDVDADNDDNYT